MAQSTAFKTYDAAGNREDLMDIVTNISPEETPMFTDFAKDRAKGRYHEWMTESLSTATSNAQIEGADYSFTLPSARTRAGNYTQIFTKTIEVSMTQEAVDKAGVQSEYNHRMTNAMKEIARDVEYALVNGTGNSGASGTARELSGVLDFCTTNVETGTGTGSEALTETMYNDLLQTIYDQGGNPDTTYANGWQKRKISAFSTSSTRNIDADDKKLINTVDVYESDFGMQAIKLDRYMTSTKIACLEKDKWRVSVLRPMKQESVAKVGDSVRGAIVGELTLTSLNEAASGQITGLSTS